MRRAAISVKFVQTIRYTSPYQKGMYPHTSGSTSRTKDCDHYIIIYQYTDLIGVLFMETRLIFTVGDVSIVQVIFKLFYFFHMGIFRSYVGGCNIITDGGLQIISNLALYCHITDTPKEVLLNLSIEYTIPPYTTSRLKEVFSGIFLGDSCKI